MKRMMVMAPRRLGIFRSTSPVCRDSRNMTMPEENHTGCVLGRGG
jgi:hypothetical protein